MNLKLLKTTSYIYLLLIPFIGTTLAFGIGHVSYKIYVPLWLLNSVLMTLASWYLGLNVIREKREEKSRLALSAFCFIIPWILISMFAGLGPPPDTAAEWTATATEQQVRYFMLVLVGVFITFGFVGLREIFRAKGENFYSLLSVTSILIAIPLFSINMLYWGFYLPELFKIQTAANATTFPDWFQPIRQLFGVISVSEVALTYFATICLVLTMKNLGWAGKTSSLFYILFSLLAFAIILLSAFIDTFRTAGYAVSIPAAPFLMPYFIGVNLLRKVGELKLASNPD